MDKVKLEFKLPENEIIEYNDNTFELSTFIPVNIQVFLINEYTKDYFNYSKDNEVAIENTNYNYLSAEINMKSYILQLLTNIDTESINPDIFVDQDFWDNITCSIHNYDNFRESLNAVLQLAKEEKLEMTSVGFAINKLFDVIIPILNKFSDIAPEQIQKTTEELRKLVDDMGDSSIVRMSKDLFYDTATNSKTRKKKVL